MIDPIDPLPWSQEAEEAVIGSLLIDPSATALVQTIAQPQDFHDERLGEIYRACLKLGQGLDFVTLNESLHRPEYEGVLAGLIASTPTSVHLEHYAAIVHRDGVRRRVIKVAGQMAQVAYNSMDSSEILAQTQSLTAALMDGHAVGDLPVSQLAGEFYDRVEDWYSNPLPPGQPRYLSTGFSAIDSMTDGMAPSTLFVLCGRPASGKCLGRGTKILMYDGSLRAVEDVKADDLLMSVDSTPRRVLSTTAGYGPMFKIEQKRGITYRANANHILSMKRSRNEGPHWHGDVLNLSVEEWVSMSHKFHTNYKGYMSTGVEFPDRRVPLEPYFLGLWLGDGTSSNSSITTRDYEVVLYLHDYSMRLGVHVSCHDDTFRITGGAMGGSVEKKDKSVNAKLRHMMLLNNKHIPRIYLINSRKKRLQLLAGLVDSDGHYDRSAGSIEITQKNKRLAEQIKFLANTLGFRAKLTEKTATIKSIGFSCIVYRVYITGDVGLIPCRVFRKQGHPDFRHRDFRHTAINVTPDGEDEYFGFELDGDGLFLLEDLTVTHNSAVSMEIARRVGSVGGNVLIFSLEMSAQQILSRWASAMSGVQMQDAQRGRGDSVDYIHSVVELTNRNNVWIDDTAGLSPSQIRGRALARHIQNPLHLVVVDHGGEMSPDKGWRGASGENTSTIEGRKTMAMKQLAKELHCPVLLVLQLNRAVEGRTNKRPTMSDLRDSGQHEQAADVILALYRESYYDPTCANPNLLEVAILKNRMGPVTSEPIALSYELAVQRFRDANVSRKVIREETL